MWALFKNRNLTLLIIGNTVSQLGDRFSHMALIALIGLREPGSAFAFSKMAVFFTLPVIILGVPSGLLADKIKRKNILLASDFSRGILLLAMAFLIMRIHGMSLVYVIVFFVFSFTILFNITRSAFIPQIVEEKELLSANSLNTLIARFATITGTVVGGVIADKLRADYIFGIDAFTYFVSFICILGIIPIHREFKKQQIIKGFQFEEVRKALKNRIVIAVMITVMVFGLISAASYSLMIPLIQQTRGLGTTGVGVMGGMIAVGMALGSYLLGTFGKDQILKPIMVASISLLGIATGFMPFVKNPIAIFIGLLLAGVFASVMLIIQDTLFQKKIEDNLRGKIFGFREVTVSISFVISTLIFGFLGDSLGINTALIISGLLVILFAVTIYTIWKD